MTITVTQRNRSGTNRAGSAGSEIPYRAHTNQPGTDTLATIRAYVAANIPATLDGASLTGVEVVLQHQDANQAWYFCEARYGGGGGFVYDPPARIAFNATLANELMAKSFSVVENGSGAGTAPDRDGLMLVNSEGKAEGTNVRRPVFIVRQNGTLTDSEVNGTYAANWLSAFGSVNNSTYAGYPAGTLLFQSLNAEPKSSGGYDVRLEFAYRPPELSVDVGDGMTIASLAGWDFLEIVPMLSFDDVTKLITTEADFFYVHRIYPRVTWADLGL